MLNDEGIQLLNVLSIAHTGRPFYITSLWKLFWDVYCHQLMPFYSFSKSNVSLHPTIISPVSLPKRLWFSSVELRKESWKEKRRERRKKIGKEEGKESNLKYDGILTQTLDFLKFMNINITSKMLKRMREVGDSDIVHLTFRQTKFSLARRNPKISI